MPWVVRSTGVPLTDPVRVGTGHCESVESEVSSSYDVCDELSERHGSPGGQQLTSALRFAVKGSYKPHVGAV